MKKRKWGREAGRKGKESKGGVGERGGETEKENIREGRKSVTAKSREQKGEERCGEKVRKK